MINIDTYGINFSDVNYVNVTIREEGCVNDRIGYFDKTGIILDMYQSHVVMMFAHLLSRVYPGDEPSRILEELAHTKYSVVDSKKYDTYAGTQHTQCEIFTKYRNTNLSCELEKNAHKGEKAVYAQTSSRTHKIYIHSDGYDNVVESLVTGKTDSFLSKHDVDCLWRHQTSMTIFFLALVFFLGMNSPNSSSFGFSKNNSNKLSMGLGANARDSTYSPTEVCFPSRTSDLPPFETACVSSFRVYEHVRHALPRTRPGTSVASFDVFSHREMRLTERLVLRLQLRRLEFFFHSRHVVDFLPQVLDSLEALRHHQVHDVYVSAHRSSASCP